MFRLLIACVLGLSLVGDAAASSHQEFPRRGTNGRAVAESSTIYASLSAMYHTIMGDTVAPTPGTMPTVSVRRPDFTPTR